MTFSLVQQCIGRKKKLQLNIPKMKFMSLRAVTLFISILKISFPAEQVKIFFNINFRSCHPINPLLKNSRLTSKAFHELFVLSVWCVCVRVRVRRHNIYIKNQFLIKIFAMQNSFLPFTFVHNSTEPTAGSL